MGVFLRQTAGQWRLSEARSRELERERGGESREKNKAIRTDRGGRGGEAV